MNIITQLRERFRATPAYTTALMVSLVVLLAGTIVFSLLAQALQRQNSQDYRNRMNRQTAALSVHTSNTIQGYNRLLHSAAAVVNLHSTLAAEEWQRLYRDLRISAEYPELVGVGYASYIKEDMRASFEDTQRAAGAQDFAIRPINGQNDYVVITYIEPMDGPNGKAIGFDMNSEAARHRAIVAARDSAKVSLTEPVKLVQDEGSGESKYGVLMYYPVYTNYDVPRTVAERRAQLRGFVYLVVRPADLVQHYIDTTPQFAQAINITVEDAATKTVLYRSTNAGGNAAMLVREEESLYLDGRLWKFSIAGQEPYIIRTGGPLLIVGLGLFASIVVAGITFRTLLWRVQTIERAFEKEVQRSKDELLALASHQLRTPASGVKQYLGLLQGGFVGELNERQQEIVQKAFDANERQLTIINELLYVSKIDAGQLQLDMHHMNITELVRSVVDGFMSQARIKDITLSFKGRRAYTVVADDRYIRMVVENLVSNALKYSHAGSAVAVGIKRSGEWLEVAVSDKGVGIDPEDQARIFQKFERVKNELSRSEGGSGLGLFLAHQLAEAHHGEIRIKSQVGKGSTFTLVLPIAPASNGEVRE